MASRRPSSMDGRQPANAALRGGGLIVLSVLVGVALLAWGFSEEGGLIVDTDPTGTTAPANGDDNGTGNGDNGQPAPDPTDDDGTPDGQDNGLADARPPEETVVYVRNGSGVTGAAGAVRNHLLSRNYMLQQPDNTPERVAETRIYHIEGWRAEAVLVANELNVADTGVVEQIPAPAPAGTEMGETSILIILGEDQLIGIAQGSAD